LNKLDYLNSCSPGSPHNYILQKTVKSDKPIEKSGKKQLKTEDSEVKVINDGHGLMEEDFDSKPTKNPSGRHVKLTTSTNPSDTAEKIVEDTIEIDPQVCNSLLTDIPDFSPV